MSRLDRPTLQRLVRLAGERLTGDWVILGGVVVPLLGGRHRVTADIDIAAPDDANVDQLNELLRIARDLGLPVESINQTGAFFLRDIPGWRDELVALHRGTGATILVPNATLYVLTKVERLTESDLDDCVAILRLARQSGEQVDTKRLCGAVDACLGASPSPARKKRLRSLRAAFSGR